jgi:hypothetical protein
MAGKSVDFTFISAPHKVPPLDDPTAENQNPVKKHQPNVQK